MGISFRTKLSAHLPPSHTLLLVEVRELLENSSATSLSEFGPAVYGRRPGTSHTVRQRISELTAGARFPEADELKRLVEACSPREWARIGPLYSAAMLERRATSGADAGLLPGERALLATLTAPLRSVSSLADLDIEQLRRLPVGRRPGRNGYLLGVLRQWAATGGADVNLGLLTLRPVAIGHQETLFLQAVDPAPVELAELLDGVEPITVVLGGPGAGKSTTLHRLHALRALDNLRWQDGRLGVAVSLRRLRSSRLDPGQWLSDVWSRERPDLPGLDELAWSGRLSLFLDGLDEMMPGDPRGWRRALIELKAFVHEIVHRSASNSVFVSCRSHLYDVMFGSDLFPGRHVELQPLVREQVLAVLGNHPDWSEGRVGAVHSELISTPLLLDLVARLGPRPIASNRSSLLTQLIRSLILREVQRDNPLLLPDSGLLSVGDHRRLSQGRADGRNNLPVDGPLVTGLEDLAVSLRQPDADQERSGPLVEAGLELDVLRTDGYDRVEFAHEVLLDYFAARSLVRSPRLELVERPPRQDPVEESVNQGAVASYDATWDEATVLAALMRPDFDTAVAELSSVNLVLAVRAATEPGCGIRPELRQSLQDRLTTRMRDSWIHVDDRVVAGLALGDLGDPRLVEATGPLGKYLVSQFSDVIEGKHVIGHDEPGQDYSPAHVVDLAPFAITVHPVTNAEFARFVDAGGYDDERWWPTAAMRAWRSGNRTRVGYRLTTAYWCSQVDDATLNILLDRGRTTAAEVAEFRELCAMPADGRDVRLRQRYPDIVLDRPEYWTDPLFCGPNQPVVGLSLYEATAYCRWLSHQLGSDVDLPTEFEWEAAARGGTDSLYPCGNYAVRNHTNSLGEGQRCTTPIGIFPDCINVYGVADLCGNVSDRTRSAYGVVQPTGCRPYGYPYAGGDERENEQHDPDVWSVTRGANWSSGNRTAVFRIASPATVRANVTGFRMVRRDA